MAHSAEPRDLLESYARERQTAGGRRRVALLVLACGAVIAALAEPALRGTSEIGQALIVALAVAMLGVMALVYACGVFYAGWVYSSWLRDRGQVRPRVHQILLLITLSGAIPVVMGIVSASESVAPGFTIAVAGFGWTNIVCSLLGYGAFFFARNDSQPR
ncbi:MAG: hypothetical protein JNM85_05755 [Chthonomonas sp.]|nr:hypothetical protein [Chthonomonas sp.]